MNNRTRRITLTGIFLAIAILLPFVTGQIPTLGKALTPMHFPVILGSLFIGPVYGLIIGVVAPLLRQLLFAMPPFPMNVMMALELGTYGLLTGILFKYTNTLIKNNIIRIYLALIVAMIAGRAVFTIAALFLTDTTSYLPTFIGLFTGSIPGIILQLVLIPILYIRLKNQE